LSTAAAEAVAAAEAAAAAAHNWDTIRWLISGQNEPHTEGPLIPIVQKAAAVTVLV